MTFSSLYFYTLTLFSCSSANKYMVYKKSSPSSEVSHNKKKNNDSIDFHTRINRIFNKETSGDNFSQSAKNRLMSRDKVVHKPNFINHPNCFSPASTSTFDSRFAFDNDEKNLIKNTRFGTPATVSSSSSSHTINKNLDRNRGNAVATYTEKIGKSIASIEDLSSILSFSIENFQSSYLNVRSRDISCRENIIDLTCQDNIIDLNRKKDTIHADVIRLERLVRRGRDLLIFKFDQPDYDPEIKYITTSLSQLDSSIQNAMQLINKAKSLRTI